jgi:hypothetical protein
MQECRNAGLQKCKMQDCKNARTQKGRTAGDALGVDRD